MSLFENAATGSAAALFGLTIAIFLFDLVRGGTMAQLEPERLKVQAKVLFSTLIGGSLLLAAAAAGGLTLAQHAPFYIVGVLFCYIVAVLNFKPAMRSMAHLAVACAIALWAAPNTLVYSATAYLSGIVLMRLVLNLLSFKDARLDDIAPAFVYLAGLLFVSGGDSSALSTMGKRWTLLSSAFIVSTLVALLQRPHMADDKILVKRLVLTLSAGLAYLVLVTKVAAAPEYTRLALLVGAGYAMAYGLDALGQRKGDATAAIRQILIVGIFTLIASRLYGNLGVAVLGAGLMVGHFTQAPAAVALFFGARVLEQVFDYIYNPNVTGINLNHSYVGASVYFGLFSALAVLALLRDISQRRVLAVALGASGALAGAAVSYFLHGEAASGYLVALTVSGLLVCLVGRNFLSPKDEEKSLSLVMVPALATASALLSHDLLELGENADMQTRLTVLGVMAAAVVVAFIGIKLSGPKQQASADAVAVAGD
jgi:hypothetical protein